MRYFPKVFDSAARVVHGMGIRGVGHKDARFPSNRTQAQRFNESKFHADSRSIETVLGSVLCVVLVRGWASWGVHEQPA